MSSPAQDFLIAQAVALRASAALDGLFGGKVRLYLGAPQTKATLPYLILGDDILTGFGDRDACLDGGAILSRVHWWAKGATSDDGPLSARAIGDLVRDLLDVELAIGGFAMLRREWQSTTYQTDPDGSTHGIATFEYEYEPSA